MRRSCFMRSRLARKKVCTCHLGQDFPPGEPSAAPNLAEPSAATHHGESSAATNQHQQQFADGFPSQPLHHQASPEWPPPHPPPYPQPRDIRCLWFLTGGVKVVCLRILLRRNLYLCPYQSSHQGSNNQLPNLKLTKHSTGLASSNCSLTPANGESYTWDLKPEINFSKSFHMFTVVSPLRWMLIVDVTKSEM